jgi:DNA invertase Pin-like site-specific DNA recombinase
MAACREGDTLVVTKLDRLARSLPDARAIADELTVRQVAPPSTAPSNATRQPPDRETADAVPQKYQCRAPTVQRPQPARGP